jgi:hypothetical protein
VFAIELALCNLAVRAAEVLVARAADVVESLHAVAVTGAPMRAISAKRGLAVGSTESASAGAFSVCARTIVAFFSVAL